MEVLQVLTCSVPLAFHILSENERKIFQIFFWISHSREMSGSK